LTHDGTDGVFPGIMHHIFHTY